MVKIDHYLRIYKHMDNNNKNINFYGKIAKMPKNTKAGDSINFLENIKVSKQKLWYILIEKQDNELQMIKYNNKLGVNMNSFIEQLKEYYNSDPLMREHINKLEIDGNDKFSIIKNIDKVKINNKLLITIITEDLIKLLH